MDDSYEFICPVEGCHMHMICDSEEMLLLLSQGHLEYKHDIS